MRNFNYTKVNLLLTLALPLVLSSCSDTWDDHYREEKHEEGTLWKMLEDNSEVSNFKTLLSAVDFKRTLDASQVFTVFAPTNEAFSAEECADLIAAYNAQKEKGVKDEFNSVVKEFVQNHIALYNYSVSTASNDTIVMMNGKYQVLGQDNISGAKFKNSNILSDNGVLYTLNQQVPYSPNLYEYLAKDADLDSLSAFIRKYEYRKFVESQSVPGEIVNGQTTYLDSVTVLTNNIFSQIGYINDEDSSYWVLAPTNEIWASELKKNEKLFQYSSKVKERDSLMYRFPRLKIVEGIFFSRFMNAGANANDVIKSTGAQLLEIGKNYSWEKVDNGWKYNYYADEESGLSAKEKLFANRDSVDCSNGTVYKVSDEWSLTDNLLKNSTIVMESEGKGSVDSVYATVSSKNQGTRSPRPVNVPSYSPFFNNVSNRSFIEIAPQQMTGAKALFDIYNVLSNVEYEVSVVVPPSNAADTAATLNSNVFTATVFYQDAKGVEKNFRKTKKLTSDPYKVDTILIGKHTFPTCSYGLSQAQVKILLEEDCDNLNLSDGIESATMRIDCFILKPTIK